MDSTASLLLCEKNPPAIDGFPWASKAGVVSMSRYFQS